MMFIIRKPIAAGSFYSYEKGKLKEEIARCFSHKLGPKSLKKEKIIGGIVPHAGYAFSGPIAAWFYSRVEKSNFLIIGTNHTGIGGDFCIMNKGLWETPLGAVTIDEEISRKIAELDLIEVNVIAHEYDHSIEVQLPFLQYLFGNDFKFVPLLVMNRFADEILLEKCTEVGKHIGKVLKGKKWIIIASSDLTHYEPQKEAKRKDKYILKAIKSMDEKELFRVVREKEISACGFGAISVAISAAKVLGGKKAEILKYATSGDVTGDKFSVVGYVSAVIK